MSGEDPDFIDFLSSIPNHILAYSSSVTTSLERSFDSTALSFREYLTHATWVPSSLRPVPPAPPPVVFFAQADPAGYAEWLLQWLNRHQASTAATVAFFGTGGYLYWSRRRSYLKKRRATRGEHGRRREVVVVKGDIREAIVKSVVSDLERRGFIVYVIVKTAEEVDEVKGLGRADILPLRMDVGNPSDIRDIMPHFSSLLSLPTSSTTPPLIFTALLLIPSLNYPSGAISSISPHTWTSTINTTILPTVATTHAFLPVLTASSSRIVVLTPAIAASLALPHSALETASVRALEGWAQCLREEMRRQDVEVVEVKVGNVEGIDSGRGALGEKVASAAEARDSEARLRAQAGGGQLINNPPQNSYYQAQLARDALLRQQQQQQVVVQQKQVRGSNVRELHHAVFDALTVRGPANVWRVGRGSLVYDLLGKWCPTWVVHWMMGVRWGRS